MVRFYLIFFFLFFYSHRKLYVFILFYQKKGAKTSASIFKLLNPHLLTYIQNIIGFILFNFIILYHIHSVNNIYVSYAITNLTSYHKHHKPQPIYDHLLNKHTFSIKYAISYIYLLSFIFLLLILLLFVAIHQVQNNKKY